MKQSDIFPKGYDPEIFLDKNTQNPSSLFYKNVNGDLDLKSHFKCGICSWVVKKGVECEC